MQPPADHDADASLDPRRRTNCRVLAVCVGNVCRSPATELLVRVGLGEDRTVEIASAGTQALRGQGIAEPMRKLLSERGVDTNGFVARQLTAPMLEQADLVIVMTRKLRATTVTLAPRSLRRTFTLRELAALVSALEPHAIDATATGETAGERLRAVASLALRARGLERRTAQDDDVVDPWLRSPVVYRESIEQTADAVDVLLAALRRG